MRLLLDTHIALWSVARSERLSARARTLIDDRANTSFVSAATVWEIAIKHAQARGGPNDIPMSGRQSIALFTAAGFTLLPISPDHAAAVETLPPLHADPFDRLLVAQAMTEPLVLLTRDEKVLAYGGTMIHV